jgi:hypothetical protein
MSESRQASVETASQPQPSWCERLFLWSTLRALGISPLAQATVLVPIFGYLVLFNEHVVRHLRLSTRFFPADSLLHLSDRLFLLYLGLFIVGVGTIGFRMSCPRVIKLHALATEFVAARDLSSPLEQGRLLRLCETSPNPRVREMLAPLGTINLSNVDHVKRVFEAHYFMENRSRRFARFIVFGLYAIGTVVLGGLSLETFISVVHSQFSA